MNKVLVLFIIAISILSGSSCKDKSKVAIAYAGYINFINGEVNLYTADKKKVIAKVGDAVTEGMRIETKGKKSFVDIYFGERAVKVFGDAAVVVNKLSSLKQAGETEFFVEDGQFFSKIARKLKKGESYNVKTKTTTAGIRGTDFLFSNENGKSSVVCLEGKVLVRDARTEKSLIISDEEGVTVVPGEDLVKQQIKKDKLAKLKIITDISEAKEEILQKFEDQRDEIRKKFIEEKEKYKKNLEDQKLKDKKAVIDQKKEDKKNIESIKGDTKKAAEDLKKLDKKSVLPDLKKQKKQQLDEMTK